MKEKCDAYMGFRADEFHKNVSSAYMSVKLADRKPRILLHACCGPCSTSCVERLAFDYEVTVFYYNPNITDQEEYLLRRDSLIKFIDAFNEEFKDKTHVHYLEGDYKVEDFIKVTQSLCNEPEGGKRCDVCFELRLEEAGRKAKELGMDYFATAMAVSPHKDYVSILRIGQTIGESNNVKFLDVDFKKKNGFGRSVELSKKYGLYRQKFCGCEYARAMMKNK